MPERPPPRPMPPPPRCGGCEYASDSPGCKATHRRETLFTALVLGVPVLAFFTIAFLGIFGFI